MEMKQTNLFKSKRRSHEMIGLALLMVLFACNPDKAGETSAEQVSYELPDVSGTLNISSTAARSSQNIYELAGSEPASNVNYKAAPDYINTRFGKLEFPGGYPTEATIQKVYDELDLQRATQLYLDMYPALSMHGMLKGNVRDYGVKNSSYVGVTANRLDSKGMYLTGNTESIYAFIVMDLKKDGPIVVKVPKGVMGPIDDHNFLFLADVGPTGKDKGLGGSYLILPPGYEGDIPDGYFVQQSKTYNAFSFLRANTAIVGEGERAMEFIRENLEVYPLAKGLTEGTYTNVSGVDMNSLVPENAEAFTWMYEMINYEPAEAFGKELLGRLESIGIQKGKDFNPDARMVNIMNQAALEAVAMSRVIAFNNRDENGKVYDDREWESPYITNNSTFYENDYIDIEARQVFHFTADGITPAMAARMPDGLGSRYQTTYKDNNGEFLDGNKTYKLHMLPNVPVAMFWSVTVYDPYSRCEIKTSQPYPSVSSQKEPRPATNDDGSVDIYFSNELPESVAEQNWIQTLPNQGFFVYIRYYGPTAPFHNHTWIPNDVERMDRNGD